MSWHLTVPYTVYTVVTKQGTISLWPVRLPEQDGKNHDAWVSAHEAADRATKAWLNIKWNTGLGGYSQREATGILTPPAWGSTTFGELLQLGFKGKMIDNLDHLVVKKLRGEA